MADAEIMPVGMGELTLISDLYNEVFRPMRDRTFFERRFKGRINPILLVAQVEKRPAGFVMGYEQKPGTFYIWLIGVLPAYRNQGIASQLMEAVSAWASDNDYHTIRFECFNQHRPMLRLGIRQKYDVVGIRYDKDTESNLVMMELLLAEYHEDT